MNILLDAYFDRNFGDDLFVDTITKLYAEYKFYAFVEYYPIEIQEWANRIPNLYLLPECAVMLRKGFFDAYICVGGDVFPNGGDFSKRQKWVDAVKAVNGKILFLGFSLFSNYSERTKQDITELMKDADMIAPRDITSAELLKKWMPNSKIEVMADLGLMAKWPDHCKNNKIKRLGIAVRKPEYADDSAMLTYEESIADVINAFLTENIEKEAAILALSNGSVKDKEVADAILEKVIESTRVKIRVYDGNLENMQEELEKCDFVICTRFHAMIACVVMGIPYCPVNYEIKMDYFLQMIGYAGIRICFNDSKLLKDNWQSIVAQPIDTWTESEKKIINYLEKGENVLEKVSRILACSSTDCFIKKDDSGSKCEEKNKLIESQETIRQYLETIEECRKTNSDYFKLIEELNASKTKELSRLNEVIREKENEINRLNSVIKEKECEISGLNARKR